MFECFNKLLKEPRERYHELIAEPEKIERILLKGAEKARSVSVPFLNQLRQATGIGPVYAFLTG